MAKKPAPKKKTAPAKPASKVAKKQTPKVAAKSVKKPLAKPVKAKAVPASKTSTKTTAKAPVSKPALMTKKGKAAVEETEEDEIVEAKPSMKSQTVVSMLETDSTVEEPTKAEKVSKIKPVKIERGNLADEKAKWAELNKKYGKEKAVPYKMSEKFPTMVPMQHKVLGWGFILNNENDRLEVLFETGIRMLISNYKS